MVLDIKHVNFAYAETPVLKDVNLAVEAGELLVLIGVNGSGKSTLMKLIIGEEKLEEGEINLLGEAVGSGKQYRHIGYVPQGNAMGKIPFPVTCTELVVQGLHRDFGLFKIPRKKHRLKARDMLCQMGLEKQLDQPFNELSGGLQQRVMIARAMLHEPKLLILDEPTAGVDEASKLQFAGTITDLNEQKGITVLLITHELDWAKEHLRASRILEMKNGGLTDVVL